MKLILLEQIISNSEGGAVWKISVADLTEYVNCLKDNLREAFTYPGSQESKT